MALAWAVFAYWEQFGQWPPEAVGLLPDGFLPGVGDVESCTAADLGARLAISTDDRASARQYVDFALSKGYFEADFISFCKQYGLCELP